ncbi:hypothetical protein [Sulfurirhabdus autotrophica]|uniref:hypothetical protein n=1 Tax=Sulfurirhabdus autotrophica TaxID=1706046 RepID=UPI000F60B5D4|nr:hypothetical protein [Sulfurirhabdus autotrophica]
MLRQRTPNGQWTASWQPAAVIDGPLRSSHNTVWKVLCVYCPLPELGYNWKDRKISTRCDE